MCKIENGIALLILMYICPQLAYRYVIDFYISTSYIVALVNSLKRSRNFFVDYRVFYVDNHVICKKGQFLFVSNLYAFYFPSLPKAQARTSCTLLNKSNENGYSCLVPYLRGKEFSIPSSIILPVGFLQIFKLRKFPSIPFFFLKVLIMSLNFATFFLH